MSLFQMPKLAVHDDATAWGGNGKVLSRDGGNGGEISESHIQISQNACPPKSPRNFHVHPNAIIKQRAIHAVLEVPALYRLVLPFRDLDRAKLRLP
jgi:hypothetical protein